MTAIVTYALADGIATVTLNRPEVLNALTAEMRRGLRDALARAKDEARVIVLTGAGRAFSSGQDLADRADAATDLETSLTEEYHPLIEAIAEHPLPVIAAVNGPAAGAAANIALACDLVIAAESAYFLQAFARIGLIPDAGGTYWLPHAMGLAKALGAALLAERIPARQAADWGMIWEAVPDADFPATVARRARQLADGPPLAQALMKRVIRSSFDHTLPVQLQHEAAAQGEAGRAPDFREGVAAFLEKRPPRFGGA